MFFAWLGTLGLCAVQLGMISHGAGVNVWDVPDEELDQYLKVSRLKETHTHTHIIIAPTVSCY